MTSPENQDRTGDNSFILWFVILVLIFGPVIFNLRPHPPFQLTPFNGSLWYPMGETVELMAYVVANFLPEILVLLVVIFLVGFLGRRLGTATRNRSSRQ